MRCTVAQHAGNRSIADDPDRRYHRSSCYPQHPPGSSVVFRVPEEADLHLTDRLLVAGSSLFIVGSIAWVPYAYYVAWKKFRSLPKKERMRRRIYGALIGASLAILVLGPHRSPRVGEWLQVRKWRLWDAWLRYIAMEVIEDNGGKGEPSSDRATSSLQDQSILAFVPHGIFPFAFAFGVLPEMAQRAFGRIQPVVATAIELFPVVHTLLKWLSCIDASKSSVDDALAQKRRIGIIPGGIGEIFEGYPKPNTRPDEEYAIVRKGFLRLAVKHGVPVVPIYCFGSTKFFKRLHLDLLERVSLLLRVSICLFFGAAGLPIPFRQKLMYVIGKPILPPQPSSGNISVELQDANVDEMHQEFCTELTRLFEQHKDAYGWPHKTLKLITR